MDLERRAWLRGIWETLKEILLQKILTYHLRSSPLVLPSHLEGLNVIVTGATSGIGLHTARELAMAGAHVVMACRNVNAANEIAQQWRQDAYHGRALNVKVMELDLLSLSSVRQFAVEWDQHLKSLHILINNAGILRMGERQECSKDGVEQHLQVNHVAPALLTLLLLPSMLKATTWRVVNVNSVLMFLKALASNLLDQGARSVLYCATSNQVVDKMVKGFAYYSSNCKPAKVSPQAAKMEACLDVWEATLSTLDLDINYLRFKLNPSCIRD
ncbi:Short-chain dehydrogenase TIC 32 [Morus notabilis]|uniref:Short-chain dehydrogenase TIC 32 n=1 Tax=Morus notabilis TaxID=981085 RepID=W9S453_9ROSA|nr:Short-chain dehydrogenase TIC 32 [Morus notabilis]